MPTEPAALEEMPTSSPLGFEGLGLRATTLEALKRCGYHHPSPIQLQLIPQALEGRDCVGNAPTGTGKTAAFLIPVLEKIDDHNPAPQVLVLAPTRELVAQIGREFGRLADRRTCWAVGVVGGESIARQQYLLDQGCQVILATPGRLLDFLSRDSIRLDQVRTVILDEADQMLDIGFRPAIDEILKGVARPRQTLLLSATMNGSVRSLTRRYLCDPVDVRLIPQTENVTLPSIRQAYFLVDPSQKLDLLVKLLEREKPDRTIVFCRTKVGADRIGHALHQVGHRAAPMHGDLGQGQRNRVLHNFRQGRIATLVATDVVGRGIDVTGVSHVINFDLPEDPALYVHRIGRTGRMGCNGVAFSIVAPDQYNHLEAIERWISERLDGDSIEGFPLLERPRGDRFSSRETPNHDPRRGWRPHGVPIRHGLSRQRDRSHVRIVG